jgi:hypothetical protein
MTYNLDGELTFNLKILRENVSILQTNCYKSVSNFVLNYLDQLNPHCSFISF